MLDISEVFALIFAKATKKGQIKFSRLFSAPYSLHTSENFSVFLSQLLKQMGNKESKNIA